MSVFTTSLRFISEEFKLEMLWKASDFERIQITVEDVNRLVLEGKPFREAYQEVGMAVQEHRYTPTREVHHTHEGSIGNLCNDKIVAKMEAVVERLL